MIRNSKNALIGLLGAALLVRAAAGQTAPAAEPEPKKPDPSLTLKLGDPKLKDKTMPVARGEIRSGASGAAVAFEKMIRLLKPARLVYVGESHNSLPMHDVQFRVLQGLHAQDRHLAVGLEMLPAALQPELTKWSLGLLTKEELLRAVRWYVNWNFNFAYYEKIFDFARERGLPVYALNAPREVISKIRMRGWDALTDAEKGLFPGPPDVGQAEHRTLVRAFFEAMDLPPQMKGAGLDMVFEGLYRSQSAWDEVMAANALRAVEREGRRLVVLAGSGHVLYNLGINRRAFSWSRLPFTTVVCVDVPDGVKALPVSRTLADFVFGLAPEAEPAFPEIGLSFKKVDGLANLVLDAKPTSGAAAKADFEKGDVVLGVDGRPFDDINEVRMHLARLRPGDAAAFRILRLAQVKDVALKIEPSPASAEKPAAQPSKTGAAFARAADGESARTTGRSPRIS
jgi:uncharacterized iron-regulated protein